MHNGGIWAPCNAFGTLRKLCVMAVFIQAIGMMPAVPVKAGPDEWLQGHRI
jgi:hypothetical protein